MAAGSTRRAATKARECAVAASAREPSDVGDLGWSSWPFDSCKGRSARRRSTRERRTSSIKETLMDSPTISLTRRAPANHTYRTTRNTRGRRRSRICRLL